MTPARGIECDFEFRSIPGDRGQRSSNRLVENQPTKTDHAVLVGWLNDPTKTAWSIDRRSGRLSINDFGRVISPTPPILCIHELAEQTTPRQRVKSLS
jgi:hypothetical protein